MTIFFHFRILKMISCQDNEKPVFYITCMLFQKHFPDTAPPAKFADAA